MPSKKKGQSTQERIPCQSSQSDDIDTPQNEQISIDKLPISLAPKWIKQCQNPISFDQNEEEQYSKSIFFNKNDSGLFMNLLDGYDWKSLSEYFGDRTKIASQLTVETINTGHDINFMSYSKISFSNQLSSIYKLIIQLIQSKSCDIISPWNLIYPQNEETGLPKKSENRLYFIKLFFCGEWRSILIDDHVPMFNNKFLFPMIADSNEIWPQLLTKAILKFLILSNRLNDNLYPPLIIQLLTSLKIIDINDTNDFKMLLKNDDNIWYRYINHLNEINKINKIELDKIDNQDWIMISAINNFVINDINNINDMHQNKNCWIMANFNDDYQQQIIDDLWNENQQNFANDQSIIISDETLDIDIILQITSLSHNNDQQDIKLFMYDDSKNIKTMVQKTRMNHSGFGSIIATLKPKKIYIVEVEGNVSYSISCYCKSKNVYISSRFGNAKTWNITDYQMIDFDLKFNQDLISKTFISFHIHIDVINKTSDILFHSVFDDEILADSLMIYCVNLDNHSMQYIPNLNLSKFNIKQNKNGYSLIGFSRSTIKNINHSNYQIKMLFNGNIQHSLIEMESTLDFKINYTHNFSANLLKDEIISDNNAKFMFVEISFKGKENYADFGKIIEFIDKETDKVLFSIKSTQSILYIPQIFIGGSKLWLNIKLDKENIGYDQDKLYKDNSIQCFLRIISDKKIRLYPDNSQTIKFEEIKKLI